MLGRAMPMLLVATGTIASLKAAPGMVKSITDNVKGVVTGMELSNLVRQWQLDGALSMTVPQPGDHEAVKKFCRAAVQSGDRDAAIDLFGNWYQLEPGVDQNHVIWISTGPNMKRDGCAKPVDGDKVLAVTTAMLEKSQRIQNGATDEAAKEDAATLSGPDDICAVAERMR